MNPDSERSAREAEIFSCDENLEVTLPARTKGDKTKRSCDRPAIERGDPA